MEKRVPYTAPAWLTPRRVATWAAMIAAPTIVARELVLLEPGIFPVHHPIALAVAILAPLLASLVVFRRFGAIMAFGIGYVLPIVSLAILNVAISPHEDGFFTTLGRVLGTPPFHIIALPIALTGAWLFGVGHANAGRADGTDRVAIRAGACLVVIGILAGAKLLSYAGGDAVPIGGWVLAAFVAIALGAGLGAILVGVVRRRALAAFLRGVRDARDGTWRVRLEHASELGQPLAELGEPAIEQGVLELRISSITDPYRTTTHYEPIARLPYR